MERKEGEVVSFDFGREPIRKENAASIETKDDKQKQNEALELIKQGKGNLYIVSQTGMSYEEVRSIRNRYEKSTLAATKMDKL